MVRKKKTLDQLKEQFFSLCKSESNGCVTWCGKTNGAGYGYFYLGPGFPGGYKGTGAHVAAYFFNNDDDPRGHRWQHVTGIKRGGYGS